MQEGEGEKEEGKKEEEEEEMKLNDKYITIPKQNGMDHNYFLKNNKFFHLYLFREGQLRSSSLFQ